MTERSSGWPKQMSPIACNHIKSTVTVLIGVQGSKGPRVQACVGARTSQCAVLGRQNSVRIWGVGAQAPGFGVEGSVPREEILRKWRKVSKHPNRAVDPHRNCFFPHPRAFAVSGVGGDATL